ncbi:GumC family protein [Neptunicoccus cionae]|nr:Wzz/FepE/Etk N-terminal domain-containing protein [Amylibacter cionae]
MYNRKPPFEDGFFPMKRIGADDRDMVDLKHLARMIWRRRILIILCTLFFGILAFVLVSQITPTYSAQSKVMLDPRESQVTIGEDVVSDLDINDQLVLSEAAVIQSNLLIEKVIAEIGFERLAILDPANQPPGLKDRVKSVARDFGLMKTPEPPTLEQALRSKIEYLVYVIRKNLSVRREGKSFVISITAKTESPQLSALLAQTIAEKYIEQQLENRQNVAKQATAWIEERLKILRAELEEAQAAGVRRRMANLQADGTSLQAISQQIFELTTKLSEAQTDRTMAEARCNWHRPANDRSSPTWNKCSNG